ncbi:g-type lectin s-receptor-like serine/threonine-protein kinase [Quercus suber]|uniref:G-type lectin s-receptor-like serine/threonine-protein kinase n=1 Tax=Quercus suber TaxID=58331 RepID=A0AAW0KGF2_QUESU
MANSTSTSADDKLIQNRYDDGHQPIQNQCEIFVYGLSWDTMPKPIHVGIDQLNTPGAFIWKDGHPFWRTGPWNGQAFIGIYNRNPQYHNGYIVVDDKEGTSFATFAYVNELPLSKFVLNSQGKLVQSYRNNRKEDWEGLNLKIIDEWNRGNWTSGCVRRAPLQCDWVNNSGEEGKEDWFFKLKTMKVPDFAERSHGLKMIVKSSYVYDAGIGFLSWSGSLIDLQKFPNGGSDIYIRLAYLEFGFAIDIIRSSHPSKHLNT